MFISKISNNLEVCKRKLQSCKKKHVAKVIKQYGIDEIKIIINSEIVSFKNDTSKSVNLLINQNKELNSKLIHVNNEVCKCKEKIKELVGSGVSNDENVLVKIIQSELSKHFRDNSSRLSTEINQKSPEHTLSESDIRAIVRDELQNSQYSQKIGENDIRRVVNEELKSFDKNVSGKSEINKEQLLMEINPYINQTISVYQSGFQTELESKNRDIDSLKKSLQLVSQKNSEYETRIISQEKEIAVLNDIVRAMKLDIDNLINKINILEKTEFSEISVSPSVLEPSNLVFGSDIDCNNKCLENIINQTKVLREKVMSVFGDNQDLDIYLKLINKCESKVGQLLAKNEIGDLEPEKLANDCVKIFKQTIVKAMSQEKLKDLLSEYMSSCNLRKLEWYVGKKLSDDDFEYLEEPILYEDVENKDLDCTICSIKQDTYIIEYMDEGEKYEVVIPGIYCLGKFRR